MIVPTCGALGNMRVHQTSDLIRTQTLDDEIGAATQLCRNTLGEQYAEFEAPASAPRSPEGWFELLKSFLRDQQSVDGFGVIVTDAGTSGNLAPGAVELYAVLQAYLVALPLLRSLPVHESVMRQFCMTCRRIATRPQSYPGQFDYRSDAFHELARIVSFRSFHAGQSSFHIMAMPRTWLLRVHPLAVPGLLREIVVGMGGIDPLVMPHVNYWRANPGLLFAKENERAFWRIAKTIEMQPAIRGLMAMSWLNCREVVTASPHLAFVREFYLNNGAYLVDMNVAPLDAGFGTGSTMRQSLYDQGQFRPRETLVLWRRAHILDWACRYELARDTGRSREGPPKLSELKPYWRFDANKILSSGMFTLFNCTPLLQHRPRRYVTLVFLLPCILAAIASALTLGFAAILPVCIGTVVTIWLFQYFCLQ
jgi:hypothetical protein